MVIFFRGIEALQREGKQSNDWIRVDLKEVLKLMEDLIKYFAQPDEADGIAEKIVKTERLFYFLFKII